MKKFIVETIGQFRQIHVVEAESEEEAFAIAEVADYNWEEYLGMTKLDIQEFTEEHVKRFREKQFWWDGVVSRDEKGKLNYLHPEVKF